VTLREALRSPVLAVVGAGVGVLVVLSVVFLTAGGPNPVWVDGLRYVSEEVALSVPTCPSTENGSTMDYPFQGATFTLWVSNWCAPAGQLDGYVVESGGTLYHFALSGIPAATEPVSWISPDRRAGVQWDSGATTAHLLVLDL
jgi:hypothetical protein